LGSFSRCKGFSLALIVGFTNLQSPSEQHLAIQLFAILATFPCDHGDESEAPALAVVVPDNADLPHVPRLGKEVEQGILAASEVEVADVELGLAHEIGGAAGLEVVGDAIYVVAGQGYEFKAIPDGEELVAGLEPSVAAGAAFYVAPFAFGAEVFFPYVEERLAATASYVCLWFRQRLSVLRLIVLLPVYGCTHFY